MSQFISRKLLPRYIVQRSAHSRSASNTAFGTVSTGSLRYNSSLLGRRDTLSWTSLYTAAIRRSAAASISSQFQIAGQTGKPAKNG